MTEECLQTEEENFRMVMVVKLREEVNLLVEEIEGVMVEVIPGPVGVERNLGVVLLVKGERTVVVVFAV